MILLMTPQNAKLVEAAITFVLLVYCYMVFSGKLKVKTRTDFIERNRKWLVPMTLIGLLYPIYAILSVIFKWEQN